MSRAAVLRAIQDALRHERPEGPPDPDRAMPRETIPDLVSRFVLELEAVSGEALRARRDTWPAAVRQVAEDAGIRSAFVAPDVDGEAVGLRHVSADEAWRRPDHTLGLVWASGAVAETGTVVIGTDGSHAPSLFPSLSVVLLAESGLVAALEDLPPPSGAERARILVTGPSRTSDIEKRLVLGAHGPRRLVVVLVSG